MPPSPLESEREHPRPSRFLIANLLGSIGFGLIALTICLPSMPEWSGAFGAAQASVQLTLSSFVIAFGVAQVIYGPLSDRYGRRRLLLLGFFLAAVGSIAAALAPNLAALMLARFVQGAGAAAGMVLGRAMVHDYFGGHDRSRVMAYIGMVMGTCPPFGTIVGGQMHVYFGWRSNFILTAVLAAILLLTTWLVVPVPERLSTARAHWLREMADAYGHLARTPTFLAYAGILAMCSGSFYVFLGGAPAVLASYGVGPGEVGFFIMFLPFSYIAGNFLTSRLITRLTESELMFIGQWVALSGIAIVLGLALADLRSPFAVAVPLILLGIGHGLLMPSTLAGTVGVVPALAGAAAGAAGLGQQMFGAFGGFAVGLFEHDSAVKLASLMMLFMLMAFASQLYLRHVQTRLAASESPDTA